ncbi:MAG TPA: 50S ribosomal protein L23 [Planctomycetota bacterium]|nr:50S ribosomal protein L23 [Planctomycetota bacterium]
MRLPPEGVVRRPLVTEKNMARVEKAGVYTFEVDRKATKPQIKDAVQKLFNVTVIDVRTATKKGLERRVGYRKTFDADVKKAIVALKDGDKIDIL